ncbi:TPA: VanZ family protein [Bacillus pseudomycoides]|nr:VanZ family protein [Bacillus pseudomycoides]
MNNMKKYMLLGIPLILFGPKVLHYLGSDSLILTMQAVLNLAIIMTCLIVLLRHTTLRNIFDWIIGICFSVYLCLLYKKTLEISLFYSHFQYTVEDIKRVLTHSVNIVPIKGIMDVLQYNPSALYQIFGNGIMLTPLAFAMLYFNWVKSIKQAIWYSFLCTVGIELIQFLQSCAQVLFGIGQGRSTDIDDVILNTMGAVLGTGCYLLWSKIENRFNKKTKRTDVVM